MFEFRNEFETHVMSFASSGRLVRFLYRVVWVQIKPPCGSCHSPPCCYLELSYSFWLGYSSHIHILSSPCYEAHLFCLLCPSSGRGLVMVINEEVITEGEKEEENGLNNNVSGSHCLKCHYLLS